MHISKRSYFTCTIPIFVDRSKGSEYSAALFVVILDQYYCQFDTSLGLLLLPLDLSLPQTKATFHTIYTLPLKARSRWSDLKWRHQPIKSHREKDYGTVLLYLYSELPDGTISILTNVIGLSEVLKSTISETLGKSTGHSTTSSNSRDSKIPRPGLGTRQKIPPMKPYPDEVIGSNPIRTLTYWWQKRWDITRRYNVPESKWLRGPG